MSTDKPDVQYTADELSSLMSKPTVGGWEAASHLVRYLAKTKALALFFRQHGLVRSNEHAFTRHHPHPGPRNHSGQPERLTRSAPLPCNEVQATEAAYWALFLTLASELNGCRRNPAQREFRGRLICNNLTLHQNISYSVGPYYYILNISHSIMYNVILASFEFISSVTKP